jgi:NADH-quinone oxidoreductase subunit D
MGPQHPSTHGVLRLDLKLDGELVINCIPDIGYLHTGMEKLFEYKKYQQGIVITDRMDYLNPLGNNLAYVMAAEKLLDLEIPERAQVVACLCASCSVSLRIWSGWVPTHWISVRCRSSFIVSASVKRYSI